MLKPSCIDLHIETDTQVVFVEVKTGTDLAKSSTIDDRETPGQLERYQTVLDCHQKRERHLAALTLAPVQGPEDPRHWRGDARWWALHEWLTAAAPTGDAYADRLRSEFVRFLEWARMTPPVAITTANVHDVGVVQCALEAAIRRAGSQGVVCIERAWPASWAAYLVRLAPIGGIGAPQEWTVGFMADRFVTRLAKRGYAEHGLSSDFFSLDVAAQQEQLANVITSLPAASAFNKVLPRLTLEQACAQFGPQARLVEDFLGRCRELGWSVACLTREVNARKGRIGVVLDAAGAKGPAVRVRDTALSGRQLATLIGNAGVTTDLRINDDWVGFGLRGIEDEPFLSIPAALELP